MWKKNCIIITENGENSSLKASLRRDEALSLWKQTHYISYLRYSLTVGPISNSTLLVLEGVEGYDGGPEDVVEVYDL